MNGTTQAILDWSRVYIPDQKSNVKTLKDEFLGSTSVPTSQRETFYIKQQATGTVKLYVDPYLFTQTATLGGAAATDKVFGYNATLQTCIFPAGSDPSIRPAQNKKVLANYSFTENLPYMYSDTELSDWLGLSISYLTNVHSITYTYTGTGTSIVTSVSNDTDKEMVSRALAIVTRKKFVEEQMQHGLGIRFRGPMAVIDSIQQMKAYKQATTVLEKSLFEQSDKLGVNDTGGIIDIYQEDVVDN